jgi:hypothetical protein
MGTSLAALARALGVTRGFALEMFGIFTET